ncbi:3-isopropylmalate dehydratase large subunit [Planctomycetes bacterium Poly30]|uniref:3-isopropylmalate dehydratase large subunit n=1 Tax=Saltatorellus ferox TaxID=2528018 RepID=A0A518EXF8_9BACT|nr:3-isopropylmalate dehydratase large subunit [Planctomycetes bacterium Poly30]
MSSPTTLFQKIWDRHVIPRAESTHPDLLYVDLHLIHEVTSPQAFAALDARGLRVRRPDRTLATMDHSTPTKAIDSAGGWEHVSPTVWHQLDTLRRNCEKHGIELLGPGDSRRGIVHVIGPELGRTLPGSTIVCGDSHTSTHGAFGALAFGIGTTEVGHVLATQVLMQRRPRTLRVRFEGRPPADTSAKDLALFMISRLGVEGGTGHVIEYQGEAVRALSMEGRMTLCNMSIEAGARAGMIAPDETTFEYLRGRGDLPDGDAFDLLCEGWRALRSDPDATFDREITIDCRGLRPMLTWGVQPAQAVAVDEPLPALDEGNRAAYRYARHDPGRPLLGSSIDVVFVGSCTNGRLEDLQAAADVLRGRRVAPSVRMLVVPGSEAVKREAEARGLDRVFRAAGAEWREPGCSMCIAMNGDLVGDGQLAVSTSNRNFAGRQGPGSRTLLASPLTAAACAIAGEVVDPTAFLQPETVST